MTSTIYIDFQPPAVGAAWLNDVNEVVYGTGIGGGPGTLRTDLQSSTGAGLVGYSSTAAYPAGSVGAAIQAAITPVGGNIIGFANVAAMLAAPSASTLWAITSGYRTAGDGGWGLYYYDPSDTTSASNACTILVATDGGRRKLFVADSISVKQGGCHCDGSTDDSLALSVVDSLASAAGVPLLIPAAMQVNLTIAIKSRIVDTYNKLFTTTSNVTVVSGQVLRPEWWGADPTNTLDSYAAFVSFFAACKGREGELSGMYKVNSPLLVDYADQAGLVLHGIGYTLLAPNGVTYNKCGFNFNGLVAASHALTFHGVRGLDLKNFFISHNLGGNSLTRTLWVYELEGFRIEGVYLEANNGVSGSGFVFGNTGGADAAFMGHVENCKAYTQGASFVALPGCTSITMQNCYQSGGYFNWANCYYCEANNCASEGAPLFGYILSGVTGFKAISCAGEANGQGVFYIQQGCSNIDIDSPFGSGNNTLGVGVPGDLVYVDGTAGTNSNIAINNPVSLIPNIATLHNIGFTGTNGYSEVTNTYAPNISKGIGASSPSYLQNYLTVSGDYSTIAFVPTIVGWTNVGAPTITGTFTKRGSIVTYSVRVVPATSIQCTLNTAQLVLPWGAAFLTVAESTASIVDENNNSYGLGRMQTNGVIWMPTTGVITTPLVITGTLMLP